MICYTALAHYYESLFVACMCIKLGGLRVQGPGHILCNEFTGQAATYVNVESFLGDYGLRKGD